MDFQNPQQLETWLNSHAVDTTQWGHGSAKTVANLWQELIDGDSHLEKEPPLRQVSVASLLVYQEGYQLIEAVQHFGDGRKRYPNRAPSEKMKPHETAEEAAIRCLDEEIGITAQNILSAPKILKTERIHRDSPSYPTLPSEFIFYTLEATVHGLPTNDFTTANKAIDDPVRSISWTWRRSQETAS